MSLVCHRVLPSSGGSGHHGKGVLGRAAEASNTSCEQSRDRRAWPCQLVREGARLRPVGLFVGQEPRASGVSQMRMSLLTGANVDAGLAPPTSMVYAPGGKSSMVVVIATGDGLRMRASVSDPASSICLPRHQFWPRRRRTFRSFVLALPAGAPPVPALRPRRSRQPPGGWACPATLRREHSGCSKET